MEVDDQCYLFTMKMKTFCFSSTVEGGEGREGWTLELRFNALGFSFWSYVSGWNILLILFTDF